MPRVGQVGLPRSLLYFCTHLAVISGVMASHSLSLKRALGKFEGEKIRRGIKDGNLDRARFRPRLAGGWHDDISW